MNKLAKLLCIPLIAVMFGCTATSRVCMTPAATDSVICPTLAKLSTTPEQVNLMFKIANVQAIRANIYAKTDVLQFFSTVEFMLKDATYMSLANYMLFEIAKINREYQLELMLVTQSFEVFQTTDTLLNEFDKGLIMEHIKQQRELLNMVQ